MIDEKVKSDLLSTLENKDEEIAQENEIQDVSLGLHKQKFRIDNDSSRILEIDTSDLSVLTRLNEIYPKLQKLETEVASLMDNLGDTDEDIVRNAGKGLARVDKQMREYIDKIFDANVSETCAPSGSMYDPINGQLRYEHIISFISSLYDKKLSSETKKIKARISKHTKKYTS